MKKRNDDKTKALDFEMTITYYYEEIRKLREQNETLEKDNDYLKKANYCMLFLIGISFACVIGVMGVLFVS